MSKPPIVPYLGINLTDITYVWECIKKDKDNQDRKAQYKERMSQFQQMLDEIAAIQTECFYSFTPDKKLMDALEKDYLVQEEDYKSFNDILYQKSYQLEGKDTKEEHEAPHMEGKEGRFASLRGYNNFAFNSANFRPDKYNLTSTSEEEESTQHSDKQEKKKSRPKLDSTIFVPPAIGSSSEETAHHSIPTSSVASEVKRSPVKKTFLEFMGLRNKKDRPLSFPSKETQSKMIDNTPSTLSPLPLEIKTKTVGVYDLNPMSGK